MGSGDKAATVIAFILATAACVLVFLVSSCVTKQDEHQTNMSEKVRIECIRQGGNWGVVSAPERVTEYGCTKK
jgi:hypothetical protein